jgi:osmotically-inducible protein OsmY
MMARFTNGHSSVDGFRVLILAASLCPTLTALAVETSLPAASSLQTIVVTGQRLEQPVPDEVLTRQVKTALHDDPFFYDEHVTVTVRDGIVYLEGVVLDAGDIKDALRIIKKRFPRIKHVVNELEIVREDSDDG